MTLYERLGGAPAIQAAVEIFYGKVTADPFLFQFFRSISMEQLMAHQRAFLNVATGGAEDYRGRGIRAAHSQLGITATHFEAVAVHLANSLRELNVSEGLIAEVLLLVGSLAKDIISNDDHGNPTEGYREHLSIGASTSR